ncbi:hypothetical protein SDC9_211301 [bioreactor metagenome]|uniref:Uncharacterized protein n=1 Tax=bioreactor metagenome TaxID=1076179 RepID=A0A645JJJ4_9ZZZZ
MNDAVPYRQIAFGHGQGAAAAGDDDALGSLPGPDVLCLRLHDDAVRAGQFPLPAKIVVKHPAPPLYLLP